MTCARSLRCTIFQAVFALGFFTAVSMSMVSGWQARFCRTQLETAASSSNYAWDFTAMPASDLCTCARTLAGFDSAGRLVPNFSLKDVAGQTGPRLAAG